MLHISLWQFITVFSGIIAGTLITATVWGGLEKLFPPLKGFLARMD